MINSFFSFSGNLKIYCCLALRMVQIKLGPNTTDKNKNRNKKEPWQEASGKLSLIFVLICGSGSQLTKMLSPFSEYSWDLYQGCLYFTPEPRVTCESLSEDKISDNPRFPREPGLAARLAGDWSSGGGQRRHYERVLVYQIVLIGLRNMRPSSVIINLFC